MKKQFFFLASLCLALTACDTSQSGHNAAPGADNTGRNVRDRNPNAMTADNQPENEQDRTITQRVRQSLMDDESLSTNAKNVKIITSNGVVTLRGPVNNEREKNEIARRARSVNGVRNVDNQLEVAGQGAGNPNAPRDQNPNMMRNDANR